MKQSIILKNGIYFVFSTNEKNNFIMEHIGTEREFSYKPDSGFSLTELKLTGYNQHQFGVKSSSCEAGFDFILSDITETDNEIVFELINDGIVLKQHYEFFDDIKVFRSYVEIINTGDNEIGLEQLSSFCIYGIDAEEILIPHNAWMRELDWRAYSKEDLGYSGITNESTKRISVSNTGTWSTKEYLPLGAIVGKRETLLWQIESNNSWGYEISDIGGSLYLKTGGGNEHENGWWKCLKAGEGYKTPVSAICIVEGGFDEAIAEMTKYRRKIAYRSPEDIALPVIVNDYLRCLNADPTTEKELPLIEAAANMGAEVFCMDAGWYAEGEWWDSVGEWEVSNGRFPNGIKEVFDAINNKGMVAGIWLEPEVMGINCPLSDKMPDECFFCRHGKRIINRGRYQLDYRNEIVVKYMNGVVDRLVKELNIGYFKFDYNIDAGLGTEIDADSFGDGLEKAAAAYLDWVDGLYKRHPDLIIENCSSGGMRMDYKMLSHCSLQSTSDSENCRPTAKIAAMSATAVLPEQAAVWSIPMREDSAETVALNMVNSAFKRIHLSGEFAYLSDENKALVKEGVDFYKSVRTEIPRLTPFLPLGLIHYESDFTACGYKNDEKMYICLTRIGENEHVSLSLPKSASKFKTVYPISSPAKVELDNGTLEVSMPRDSGIILELE